LKAGKLIGYEDLKKRVKEEGWAEGERRRKGRVRMFVAGRVAC
jgi:hypothetical protein